MSTRKGLVHESGRRADLKKAPVDEFNRTGTVNSTGPDPSAAALLLDECVANERWHSELTRRAGMMVLNCCVFCRCEEEEGALFVFSASRVPTSTANSLPPTVELTAKAVADAGTPTKAGTTASTMDVHGREKALEAEQPVP